MKMQTFHGFDRLLTASFCVFTRRIGSLAANWFTRLDCIAAATFRSKMADGPRARSIFGTLAAGNEIGKGKKSEITSLITIAIGFGSNEVVGNQFHQPLVGSPIESICAGTRPETQTSRKAP